MVESSVEVFVDDRPVSGDAVLAGTLEEALMHVQSEHCGPDHMVVALRCDGKDVPAAKMADALRQPARSFSRIDVTTTSRFGLVVEAMTHASACLAETEVSCRHVAEMLTEGRAVEGVELLGECLRVWQQVHDAVQKSVGMLGLDASTMEVGSVSLIEALTGPRDLLLRVRDALQSRDHVLLADILRYEFTEVTDKWHSVLARIRREAEERVSQA